MADASNCYAGNAEQAAVAVFSPALQLTIELHLTGEGLDEVHLHAGGQGYWVSKMIAALGGMPIPCAPVGGEAGDALCSIIAAYWTSKARLTPMSNSNAVIIEDRRDANAEHWSRHRSPRSAVMKSTSCTAPSWERASPQGSACSWGRNWLRCSTPTRSAASSSTCVATEWWSWPIWRARTSTMPSPAASTSSR